MGVIKYLLEYSPNGKHWGTLADRRGTHSDFCHDFILVEEGVKASFLRVSHMQMPFNEIPSISGLRVLAFQTVQSQVRQWMSK